MNPSLIILFLRRTFLWRYVVADNTMPLLGIDFLFLFNLFIDCGNGRPVDQVTRLEVPASQMQFHIISVILNLTSNLLSKFINFYKNLTP